MHKVNEDLAKMIIEAAEDAGYDTRSYSGRGMYGQYCLGISFDSYGSPTDIVIDILSYDALNDKLAEALKGARTDSMGLGGVIYWPHIPYIDSEDSGDVGSEY